MKKRKIQISLVLLGIVIIFIIGWALYHEFNSELRILFEPKISRHFLLKEVRSHGVLAAALLVLLTTVMCALPGLPTSVIGIFIGVCYGPFVGSCLNLIGNAIGNVVSLFLLDRFNFLNRQHKDNHWVKSITAMRHPKIGLMIAYMVPIIPSFLVNFTAEHTLQLKIKQVLAPLILGALPASILYACGGEAIFKGYNKTAVVIIVSVLFLVFFIKIIYQDKKRRLVQ